MTAETVLIVDDDASLLEMVSAFLAGEGFSTRTAANGAEALESVTREKPALVLLDIHMPVMDGWTFARELRARGSDIPLVIMTAARDARGCAEEIGAAAYVVKPVNLPQLLGRINRICTPAR